MSPDSSAANGECAAIGATANKLTDRQRLGLLVKALPRLAEAGRWGTGARVAAVYAEIADLIESTHPGAARDWRVLAAQRQTLQKLPALPDAIARAETPRLALDDVVLPAAAAAALHAFITEHQRRDTLAAFDLTPRHRLLLHGAPGNGKTLTAEALAQALALPFLRVRYGGLIDSHLGTTGKNLDALFEFAASTPCLVFIDEFDSLGLTRGAVHEPGEMRRIANHLLIALERLPSTCVLVAATNVVDQIDPALRRRFDLAVELPAPDAALRTRCAARELAPSRTPGFDVAHLAPHIARLPLASLHEVVELCQRVRRDLALNGGTGIDALLGG